MALSDFLSNGQIPAGSAVKSTTSQTVLPDWYTNYAMDILSGQQQIASNPLATYQGPRVAGFTPTQVQGQNATVNAAGAYQPGLTAATQATSSAMTAPGALTVAQPFLNGASGTSVSNINQYMNPYTDAVVKRIGELGARNLNENIMPNIEGRYIAAGQLGMGNHMGATTPSGMMTDTARAIRDTQEATLAQQAQALQSGYSEAAGLANTDLNRQANLASTAGGLATQQQTGALNAAGQMAGLAGQAQTLGLQGAGALGSVGQQQQTLDQQNLDVAYQDFLKQQGYPQEQINNMVATMKGALPGVPTSTQEEGIVPNAVPTTSTASNIGAGLTGLAGVLAAIGKL